LVFCFIFIFNIKIKKDSGFYFMKEIKAIISAYDGLNKTTTAAALATVVRVDGSSYRRTGARMLVTDSGIWVGGISGGCLEGDALKKAQYAIIKSESSLVTYDTTDDDPYQIGVGLGCQGVIDILFTPLDYQNKNNPVEVLKSCIETKRQMQILITLTDLKGEWGNIKAGDVIRYKDNNSLKVFGEVSFEKELEEKINQQIQSARSKPEQFEMSDGRKLSVFIEILLPEIHLILMGHQYDIYPLTRIVADLGWRATVVSYLFKLNNKIVSPGVSVFDFDKFGDVPIDEYSAIVLMSHDFKTDKLNLARALATRANYIGILGPRVRAEKIFKELEQQGIPVWDEDQRRIYAPAGLDIGALSPEEIALSLLAEIRTVFSNREGGSLRLRGTTIHERN
jgi:xanthine/CO dehydrogenase XdhC/CoxF family maturation factor